MTTRARRWLVIAVCIGVPIAIVWTGTASFSPRTKLDPSFPPACVAIYRQVSNHAADKAAEAAATLATASGSTREEQICAEAALSALTLHNVTAEAPELDLSKKDRCAVAQALENHGASRAAFTAYTLLRDTGTLDEQVCGRSGVDQLASAQGAKQPQCDAAARLLVTGPEKSAADVMTRALGDPDTSADDAVCIVRVIGAVHQFDSLPPTPPTSEQLKPKLAPNCSNAAEDARLGDLAGAREDYKKQLSESTDPESQACAIGGLARLPGPLTFADWSFVQANRVTEWGTGWVPGGPVIFATGSKTVVIAVFWFFTLGLLLVALRQFVRWRRERWPGPVTISAVKLPTDEKDAVDVAETMRECLSRAGIYEHPYAGSIGELLIDVSAALSAIDDTGIVGKAFKALKGSVALAHSRRGR
jgi:hypothetical protein